MPRGVKRTVDHQIAEINAKIAKKRDEIKALEARRRDLEDSRQVELATQVVRLAAEKGVSIEKLLEKLG
jgi:vacuolar-type H+-ATPase subunit I/STV1